MIHQCQLNTSFKFEKQAKGFSTINILKETDKQKKESGKYRKQSNKTSQWMDIV